MGANPRFITPIPQLNVTAKQNEQETVYLPVNQSTLTNQSSVTNQLAVGNQSSVRQLDPIKIQAAILSDPAKLLAMQSLIAASRPGSLPAENLVRVTNAGTAAASTITSGQPTEILIGE